jgi:hypothetical protein
LQAKSDLDAHLAQPSLGLIRGRHDPRGKAGLNRRQGRRLAVAPILPRKVAIPVLPEGLGGAAREAARAHLAHEREIGDGQRRVDRANQPVAIAVAEGIELLDIAETLARLTLDPVSQA